MCNKYRYQKLKTLEHFVHDTTIEKQIEYHIRNKSKSLLSFLTGAPGTGKTSAIKKIITQLRKKSEERNKNKSVDETTTQNKEAEDYDDIYYFTWGEDDEKSPTNI